MSQTSIVAEQDRKKRPEADVKADYDLRLRAHSDRLDRTLETVYGERSDFNEWLERLHAMMAAAALARPALRL